MIDKRFTPRKVAHAVEILKLALEIDPDNGSSNLEIRRALGPLEEALAWEEEHKKGRKNEYTSGNNT